MNEHTNGTNGNGAYSSNGNGNGKNGHEKIFDLNRSPDPLLSIYVPQARKRVAVMHNLSFGARNFFQWLTDQSLTPGSNIRKGVIKISDRDAGARFKVSDKTIRNWKREIADTGEVWLTERWMKNSFPQTVYNIAAIVGQPTLPLNADSDDGSLADDEVFSSNRRRQQAARRDAATGMFASRGTPPRVTALEVSVENPPNQAETATAGIFLPPTAETICRPPRKQVSAHRGKNLPSPTEKDCRLPRQPVAAVGGNAFPRCAETGFRGERQPVAGNGKTRVGELVLKEKGGSPLPPMDASEAAFNKWLGRLDDMRNSDLRQQRETVQRELNAARSKPARDMAKRKLAAIRERWDGPTVPDVATPAAALDAALLPKMDLAEARDRMAKARAEAGV